MAYWSPGDVVVERHLRQGKLWSAIPHIVACDGPELSALYIPPGTVCTHPCPIDSGPLRLLDNDEEWQFRDWTWQGEGRSL